MLLEQHTITIFIAQWITGITPFTEKSGFYAWATFLVLQPTGEHQFYTALNLKAIYERSLLTDKQDTEKERLLNLCIRAFQSVLDHFPKSVTYDRTGKIPYGLGRWCISLSNNIR